MDATVDPQQSEPALETQALVSPELVAGLQSLLSELAASPRFALFQHLTLGGLLADLDNSPIAHLTLGAICDEGALGLCQNPFVNDEQLHQLVKTLSALVAEPGKPAVEAEKWPQEELPRVRKTRVFSSVQAAQLLEQAAQKLRSDPRFETIQHNPLQEFWAHDLPSAPFEASLTIKQFVEFPKDVLLKKRSMNDAKIDAMLHAIQNALSDAPTLPTQNPPPVHKMEPPPRLVRPARFREDGEVQPHLELLVDGLEKRISQGEDTALWRVMRGISERVGRKDLLSLLLAEDLEEATVSYLLLEAPEDLQRRIEYACGEVRSVIREEGEELLRGWELALSGAGAGRQYLIDPYLSDREDIAEFSMCRLFLRVLGVSEIVVPGQRERFWTSSLDRIEALLSYILARLPLPSSEMERLLHHLFPLLSPYQQIYLISARASLDEAEGMWISSSG